jgi:hypothetical protein
VTLDSDVLLDSDWERAVLLAHELQHAADHASGVPVRSQSECYAIEENAFVTQAKLWLELWGGVLPEPQTYFQEEINTTAELAIRDPGAFVSELTERYRHDCGS